MTEQEKQLLLKYLCAMLPYEVKYCRECWDYERDLEMCAVGTLESIGKDGYINDTKVYTVWDIKPYLRPLSSMTEKEYETFPIPYSFDSFSTWNNTILSKVIEGTQILIGIDEITVITDWLNARHFDYRNLIGKGLALEAPEGMYDTKNE